MIVDECHSLPMRRRSHDALGNYMMALETLERVRRTKPDYPRIEQDVAATYQEIAKAYRQKMDTVEALRWAEKDLAVTRSRFQAGGELASARQRQARCPKPEIVFGPIPMVRLALEPHAS